MKLIQLRFIWNNGKPAVLYDEVDGPTLYLL